jgi:hypothetical protein
MAGLAYRATDSSDSDWVLARYTARGKLDRSFGSGGVVMTSFGTGED